MMMTRSRTAMLFGLLLVCPLATPLVTRAQTPGPLPGMPPVLDRADIYAADRPGRLSRTVEGMPSRIYVPNTESNTVTVIDPTNYTVIDTFKVGRLPQHVTPSYDMTTLWVLNDMSSTLTEIDPTTGKKGRTVPVDDPYNMYYTPDGQFAIVVAEQRERLMFRDAKTMQLKNSLAMPCKGVDHMDFSADGRYLIASCEFGHRIIKVDVASQTLVGSLKLGPGTMPQDVKLSPDGQVFYVADMMADGVHLVDGENMTTIGFLPTGKGAHGLYVSRDSKVLYVSNRGEGSVSVVDLQTRQVAAKWKIPGGGSPDMGGVSANGEVLWLSGRYNAEVYAIDAHNGHPDCTHSRGSRSAWPLCVSAAGALFPRSHRRVPLNIVDSAPRPESALRWSRLRVGWVG